MEMPIFELQMGEDWTEVSLISFVDDPAIKRNFFKFRATADPFKFSAQEDKRIVTGPVLIPDVIIPRNIKGVIFNVVFRAEQIKKIYEKVMASGSYQNANFMHSAELDENDCHIYECFMSDKSRGIMAPAGFEDLPDLTWYMSHKITSDELWEMIKSGKISGYSIEGHFKMIPVNEDDLDAERIMKDLQDLADLIKNS
jgi:hypothetical protein